MNTIFIYTVLNQTFNFNSHLEVFVIFQTSWEQTRSLYLYWTTVLMTVLWGGIDKQSGFNSKLCGKYALVWEIPARDTVLSDGTMGQEATGSRESSIYCS